MPCPKRAKLPREKWRHNGLTRSATPFSQLWPRSLLHILQRSIEQRAGAAARIRRAAVLHSLPAWGATPRNFLAGSPTLSLPTASLLPELDYSLASLLPLQEGDPDDLAALQEQKEAAELSLQAAQQQLEAATDAAVRLAGGCAEGDAASNEAEIQALQTFHPSAHCDSSASLCIACRALSALVRGMLWDRSACDCTPWEFALNARFVPMRRPPSK